MNYTRCIIIVWCNKPSILYFKRLILVGLVVAKMKTTVRDVKMIMIIIAFQCRHIQFLINVNLPELVPMKSVAVPLPIAVWVARIGFGRPAPNNT